MARLLAHNPGLLTAVAGPQQVSDSTVVQVRDTTVLVRIDGQLQRVTVPWRDVTRYRSRTSTLVLDNARARRQLADAHNRAKLLRDELQASQREVGRLNGLAYPRWYNTTWFWISLLLFSLLACSIVLRFAKFSLLPF